MICDLHVDLVELRDDGATQFHKIAGAWAQMLVAKLSW
jgi:hypothetical protein